MYILLLVILVLLLIGALPRWPYAQNWGLGYYPSGFLALLLIIIIILMLFGRPT